MPPKPSDPDPISDPKRHFLHSIVSQGEEYLPTLWMWVCRPRFQILNLFQTPKDISYTLLLVRGRITYLHFGRGCSAQAFKSRPYFRPQKTCISYTLLLVRGRNTYLHFGWGVAPKPSILAPFQTQTAEIDILLQTNRNMFNCKRATENPEQINYRTRFCCPQGFAKIVPPINCV